MRTRPTKMVKTGANSNAQGKAKDSWGYALYSRITKATIDANRDYYDRLLLFTPDSRYLHSDPYSEVETLLRDPKIHDLPSYRKLALKALGPRLYNLNLSDEHSVEKALELFFLDPIINSAENILYLLNEVRIKMLNDTHPAPYGNHDDYKMLAAKVLQISKVKNNADLIAIVREAGHTHVTMSNLLNANAFDQFTGDKNFTELLPGVIREKKKPNSICSLAKNFYN